MADILDIIKSGNPIIEFIRGLASSPASARSILTQARAAGYSIANSTGLQVINYFRSNVETPLSYVQNLANDKLPNINNLQQSLTNFGRNFFYTVEFKGIDATTNEPTTQHITVSTNQLLTKQQAIDFAVNIIEDQPAGYNIIEYTPEVTNININSTGLVQPLNSSGDSEIPF